ncbi:sensor histidine kinase/GAF domain hybrid protein [unidentified eubacterium SCB49]|nr:sensor histidine kinase/GAF domain hybrid protein [unidentified eubacterium SCB49]
MIEPVLSLNELQRIEVLKSYDILHTDKSEDFDQLTDIAKTICNMPVSLISFMDEKEVWNKSANGFNTSPIDKNSSFCNYTVSSNKPEFIVNNTLEDDRFKNHPYVIKHNKPVLFYAGVALIDSNGFRLGSFCVIDHTPNTIDKNQLKSLHTLGRQVIKLLELHKANNNLTKGQKTLEFKNQELKKFAGIVSHDMKMPLANIILSTDILKAKYKNKLDTNALEYLNHLKQSTFTLSEYITGLLEHYESDKLINNTSEVFDIHDLLEKIVDLLNINFDCEIHFPEKNIDIHSDRVALEQVFLNLMANSIKYNDKNKIVIKIECDLRDGYYYFKVTDNGVGIPEEKLDTIFDLFSIIGNKDRNGQKGNGIGLSTVKKIVTNLGGFIEVKSHIGVGSTFKFSIKKETNT